MPDLLIKDEKVPQFFDALECLQDRYADQGKQLQACIDINKTIGHFVERPKRVMKKQLQAFKQSSKIRKLQSFNGGVTAGDLPQIIQDNVSILMDSDARIDGAHKALFDQVPSVDSLDYFEIATLSNSIVFKKLPEGEKVPIYGMTGSMLQVPIEKDGAALSFTEEVVKYRKIWRVVQIVKEFRFAHFKKEADDFGALLATAGALGETNGYVQAYDSASGTAVEKTIRTLNAAYIKATAQMKARPYGDMVRPEMVLIASPLKSDVLDEALSTYIQPMAGSKLRVNKPISVLYTWNEKLLPDTNEALLCLPGRSMQWTEQGTMQNYNYTDPLSLVYAAAYYNWHGEGIGDTDQVLTTKLA